MPEGANSYTQKLSQDIDAAHQLYTPGEPESETRLYRAFLAQARNVVGYEDLAWSAPTLARDIASRALVGLPSFRGRSKVPTWFYRIARNEVNRVLRTIIRDRKKHLSISTHEGEEHTPSEVRLTAKPTDLQSAIDLERLLERLPREQGDVLALQLEGYTLNQIARRTGIPLGTIRSRNRLAKARIAKAKGQGETPHKKAKQPVI